MAGLMIAVPHTRSFYGEWIDSIIGADKPYPTVLMRCEGQALDIARNMLVRSFLQHPAELSHLLWIDSDATWGAEAIYRLIERKKDIICGCMYKRSVPPVPTMGTYVGKSKDGSEIFRFGPSIRRILEHARRLDITTATENAIVLPKTDDDLWQIGGCGMHFTLVRREVLEKTGPPWFMVNEDGAGEDFYFCLKAVKEGFTIWNDLSVHTGHSLGEGYDVGLRELLAWTTLVEGIDDRLDHFDMQEEHVVGKW